ncbi:MAG: permease [Candidatus Muiribacteriota bacterium]
MITTFLEAGLGEVYDFIIGHFFIILPAFMLSGAIGSLINKFKILKYMGPEANKGVSYSLASVVGICLSVCACGIVPLFTGIYSSGVGIGPAITFLFSGPALNITAITLTFLLMGSTMGISRIIVTFAGGIIIGMLFSYIFKKDRLDKKQKPIDDNNRKWWQTFLIFLFLFTLIFLPATDIFNYNMKWSLYGLNFLIILFISWKFLSKEEIKSWVKKTIHFAKKIIIPMLIGVFMIGVLRLYATESDILFWVQGNTWKANFIASVAASILYFGSCVSVPLVAGLMALGLHHGPALTLLLAGPAVSLPTFLAVRKVMGNKKSLVYIIMVIIFSMIAGKLFGSMITLT